MFLRIAPFVSPCCCEYTALEFRAVLTVETEEYLTCGRTATVERFLHPRKKETRKCEGCLKSQFFIVVALVAFKSADSLVCSTCRYVQEFATMEHITVLIDKGNGSSKVACGIRSLWLELYGIRFLRRHLNMAVKIEAVGVLVEVDTCVSYSLKA